MVAVTFVEFGGRKEKAQGIYLAILITSTHGQEGNCDLVMLGDVVWHDCDR
jgi:hypothetical protein